MRTVKIGLLGCGTVGGGFVRLLETNHEAIRQRAGVDLEITRILVRDLAKARPGIDVRRLTTSADDVICNGSDMIVELVGGITDARGWIREAVTRQKHVVTANKALLALAGSDLAELAAVHRVRIGYEASVCGALPIIRVLRGGLAGDRITRIEGVLNGTSNFILTRMEDSALSFDEALQEAQCAGFAEADPALDIDGIDSAQKLTILAELAFGHPTRPEEIEIEGIRQIAPSEIREARDRGLVIRHVARAVREEGRLRLTCRPERLPRRHPLASVRDENNGIVIEAEAAGELVFCGKGAGSFPTASSVLSDVIEIATSQR